MMTMLRIGICDDEKAVVEQLRSILVKLLFSYTDVEYQSFLDGQEIIDSIQNGAFKLDLLFLDIHMEKVDGLKTAEFIRKHGVDVDIIFLTASKDYVFEGYRYRAFAYHLKPVKEALLEKDLLRYLEEKRNLEDCLTIQTKSKKIHLPLNRVIYFKSEGHKITAHTLAGGTVFYGKLDDLEEQIGQKGFVRCHQSYMVNRSMIDAVGRKEIHAQGITVPMSRKYYESGELHEKIHVAAQASQSLAANQTEEGAIVFVKGKLLGAIIRIQQNCDILVGRDGTKADIVVHDGAVSRLHCSICYNGITKDYSVCDYSSNGLYREDGSRLPKGQKVRFVTGEKLLLGNDNNVVQLG
jgi:DNA-binding LytR/AlgR family response regulator